jgi:chitodextrinase
VRFVRRLFITEVHLIMSARVSIRVTFALLTAALLSRAALCGDFPNVTQVPGTLINGPIAPEQGRTAIVAWHGGRIISVPEAPGSQDGADLRVRITNINDLNNPVVTVMPYAASGFNAHAYFQYGPYFFVGPHETVPGNGNYRDSLYTTGPGVFQERNMEDQAGLPIGTYTRSGTQSPWGARMWWSYDSVSGLAYLAVRRSLQEYTHDWNNGGAPTGPAVKATWDHLAQTGVIGMPFIIGNILIYASDQTGTGVATYDISDPSHPILLDVLKEGNPGGYWPEVYSHYIFFPRRDGEGGAGSQAGFMVVDFEDPTNLRVVANRNLPGSNQYVTFQDEFAFMNNYKIDMRTFDTVLTLPTNSTTLDASQFALPVGNLVITGGYGSLGPGLAIWAHQAAPDTRGPFVAYHVPTADQTNYSRQCPITLSIPETLRTETIVNGTTLIVRPVGGAPVNCWHSFGQNKLLTVTPMQPLAANTTYEVVLTSGIQDAAGNGLEPYSFRFSTGSGVSGGNRPPAASTLSATPAPAAPNALVSFTATASDPDGDAIEYRFDYGDGTPKTAWSSSPSGSHSYTSARHYHVTVQVRDPSGALSSFSRGITVTTPFAGALPVNSSPLTLDAAARRVWNVNPDSNTLTALDADSLAKVWEQPTGADPRSVAPAAGNTLWVACHDADRVDVLNAANGALIQSIPTGYGSAPVAACASPDGNTVYVSCTGDGTFRRFNVATRTQSGTLALGPTPRAIAITASGARALVTRFISGENEGSVYDVNLAGAMTLTRTIRLARHWVQDGSASGRGVPNYLAGITLTPDSARAWVVGKKDNTERGTFTAPSVALGQDSTVRAQLVVIDLTTNQEDTALRMDIDNSESPTAVAFSPLGDYAFISLQGNNQVAVVDHLEFMRTDSAKGPMTRLGTGLAPQGVAMDAASGRLFSQDFLGRTVTATGVNPLFVSGSLNLPGTAVNTVASELLAPAVLRGKRIFYNASDTRMSAEGYISCATCHVDGGHDGRTWDFTQRGEGFRNTTDLRGRSGIGHGAVHWTANFDEIQDFENDIRGAFGGSGFMSDANFAATSNPLGAPKAGLSPGLDDLSAYVTSLGSQSIPRSTHRLPDGAPSASAQAGAAIFQRENCASCHNPATGFTDRTRHNVGTLTASSGSRIGGPIDGIDTPTLLGLHAGAPYFHNGSARTLGEVVTVAGGDLRQAESGTLANGATAGDISWEPMKQWHGSLLVVLDATNHQVTFNNVDGGPGGTGYLEIRYTANYGNGNLTVIANGTTVTTVTLPLTPNNPNWMPNEWRIVRVNNVPFAPGATNTVTLRRAAGSGQINLDDVLFSTPAINALAQPHRRVAALPTGEINDLTEYLLTLDGQDAPPPPALVSIAATPNPALPGATVQFSAAATGAPPLSYRWDFGDGAGANGASVSHVYLAEGIYVATVFITDVQGQVTASTVTLQVGGPGAGNGGGGGGGGGTPLDSDGDGVDDDAEIADGTDPFDPTSVLVRPLGVSKAGAKMSFKFSGKDSLSIAGTVDLPAGFDPLEKTAILDVGGATETFTLDAKGRAKNGRSSFALSLKFVRDRATKIKSFAGGSVKFKAKLSGGTWAGDWADEGVASDVTAKKTPMSMTAQLRINGQRFDANLTVLYTGKAGVGGNFKSAK